LVLYKHHWGEDRVYGHAEDGDLIGLPASWTDVVAADPFVAIANGRAHFRTEDLWALVQLVRRRPATPAADVKEMTPHVSRERRPDGGSPERASEALGSRICPGNRDRNDRERP
jgi:hypothetical protein